MEHEALRADAYIEDHGRLDAARLHVLQVGGDAIFGDIAVHPVPVAVGHDIRKRSHGERHTADNRM